MQKSLHINLRKSKNDVTEKLRYDPLIGLCSRQLTCLLINTQANQPAKQVNKLVV